MGESTIYGNGINQEDLVALMVDVDTKWAALLAKLDADSQLTADDYVSTLDITWPSGIQTSNPYAIRDWGQVWTWFLALVTNYNDLLAKLDTDALAGLDNNYASSLAISAAETGYASLGVQANAWYQGSLVYFTDLFITKFNLLLAKLDADPLDASNYVSACAVTDTVDEAGTEGNPLSHGGY